MQTQRQRKQWRVALAGGISMLAVAAARAEEPGLANPFAVGIDTLKLAEQPAKLAEAPKPVAQDDGWHIVSRLGLWAVSLNGDVGVRDRTADVDADFSDLIDKTNFALAPGFELSKDKWVFTFNGFFSQLESDNSFSGTLDGNTISGGADITMDMYIVDLALGYRLCDLPLGQDMVLSLTPAVGIRYTYLGLEIDPDNFASRDANESWWDPYVGGRANLKFNEKLAWRTDASVGGFGVGSDFTWTVQSFIDWRFSQRFELNVGYRAIGWDYDEDNFEWDMTMHGPWIGVSVHWK